MRKRSEIEKSGTRPDILAIELLLDIRDLLIKKNKKKEGRKKWEPGKKS